MTDEIPSGREPGVKDSREDLRDLIMMRLTQFDVKLSTAIDLFGKRLDTYDERHKLLEKRMSQYTSLGNIITLGTGIGVTIVLHVINSLVHANWG